MRIAILLLWSCAAAAQTTTVTGTMTDAAGDLLSGSCSIQAIEPFSAADGWRVTGAPMVVSFSGGSFSASLAPTDSATPAGQYYKVTCAVPKQSVGGHAIGPYSWGPRYWLVPTSSKALDVSVVETSSAPPSPSLTILWQQMAPLSGMQAGQAPIWNGASWQPGTVTAYSYTPENTANKGAPNGYASLDANQFVPAANIPGLTGDVIKNAGSNATTVQAIRNYPVTPNAPADGQLMRWSGSAGQWMFVAPAFQEAPAGAIDGTNLVFTLANTPAPEAGLVLTLNGLVLQLGNDYTLSGSAITFIPAAAPQPGDSLLASYWH